MRRTVLSVLVGLVPIALAAQETVQNATLRLAIQAYEALDFPQVILRGRAALRQRGCRPCEPGRENGGPKSAARISL